MKFKIIIDKDSDEELIARVHKPSLFTDKLESLVNNYNSMSEDGLDGVAINSENEMRIILFEEIECITVIERKIFVIDINGIHHRISERLRDLEEVLPSYFIRINKSTLANEHRILRFEAVFSGGINAIFRCGHCDYVSRRCYAEIKRRYKR